MTGPTTTSQSGNATIIEGAGGVVFNQYGHILLLHHKKQDWVFPKGHIDPGESKLEAAIREVEEEAGVFTHCPEPTYSEQTRYVNPKNEQRLITWFALITTAIRPTLRESIFPEGAFLPPEDALERLSFNEDRQLLSRMLNWYQRWSTQA